MVMMAVPPPLLLVHALLASLLLTAARAAEYVVGGDAGWDSGVNYAAWESENTFYVGDVLVFQYVSSQHNVYEVTQSTYRSCDTSGNGVLARYATGYDTVPLAEARPYWFICDFPQHCIGGMKLAVLNVSASAGGGGGGVGPALVPPSPPPPPDNNAGRRGCLQLWPLAVTLVGVLFFMN